MQNLCKKKRKIAVFWDLRFWRHFGRIWGGFWEPEILDFRIFFDVFSKQILKRVSEFGGKAKGCMPKSKFLAFKFERPKTVVVDTILQGIWSPWGHPGATWTSQNHPKSSPGASKIEPGALQDAFFKRHLT